MPVDSKHPEYIKRERDWELLADCVEGQRAIKRKGERYLPKPNPEDDSDENEARYKAYKLRAIFHNVTARTVGNYQGQCFALDPVATMPDQMKPWLEDIDGAGMSANQQSKKALGYCITFSRAGLWVDYPEKVGTVSKLQEEKEGIRPKIVLLDPRKIINWRTVFKGTKALLSLVVMAEDYIRKDDGFLAEWDVRYRVLRLVDGVYISELWEKPNAASAWTVVKRTAPTKGDGSNFDEIPFVFIGAEANSPEVEKPLMLDIANLNIGHYRNSADYEEAVYMVGQPTPWVSGLTPSWVSDQLKGQIMLGSRAIIPLPENAAAGLMQANPNTLPKEAMDQKEELMTALGAKLAEKSEVQQTATEKGLNEASSTSILATCCHNVSEAYGMAWRWSAEYAAVTVANPDEDILFELNTDFAIARMTPEEATATQGLYDGRLITFEEARDKLVTGGWAYLSDEKAKDQLEQQAEDDFEKAKAEMDAQAKASAAAKGQPPAKPAPAAAPVA